MARCPTHEQRLDNSACSIGPSGLGVQPTHLGSGSASPYRFDLDDLPSGCYCYYWDANYLSFSKCDRHYWDADYLSFTKYDRHYGPTNLITADLPNYDLPPDASFSRTDLCTKLERHSLFPVDRG